MFVCSTLTSIFLQNPFSCVKRVQNLACSSLCYTVLPLGYNPPVHIHWPNDYGMYRAGITQGIRIWRVDSWEPLYQHRLLCFDILANYLNMGWMVSISPGLRECVLYTNEYQWIVWSSVPTALLSSGGFAGTVSEWYSQVYRLLSGYIVFAVPFVYYAGITVWVWFCFTIPSN